jgi:hypothetical protein
MRKDCWVICLFRTLFDALCIQCGRIGEPTTWQCHGVGCNIGKPFLCCTLQPVVACLQAGFETPSQKSNSPRHRTVVAQKPMVA